MSSKSNQYLRWGLLGWSLCAGFGASGVHAQSRPEAPASAAATATGKARPAAVRPSAAAAAEAARLPDCRDDPPCMELVESARRLSSANQLNAALVTYEQAYRRSRSAWLQINIGRIQQKLGRPAEAILTYRHYLEDAQNQPQEGVEAAREYLKQAEKDLEEQRERERWALQKPVYKKWWFWVSLVGAAAAVGAVTAGIVWERSPPAPNGERSMNHFIF